MSTTNPDYSTVIVPLFKTYGQAIQPTLVILMLHTVFGAMLVPLLVALVYFSTPKHRQVYMFWFVILDVILGIAVAAWYGSALTGIILDPLGAVPVATYIALTILPSLSGCMVDLTLMLRLYAVYPLQSTRKSRFMVIFCIPAAIKVARIVLKIIILVMVTRKTTAYIKEGGMDSVSIGNALIDMPTIKIEACCALVDHMFVSASFLLKLYGGFARSGDSSRITNGSQASIASRIRTLFQIALSNLIFTVIFDVVTLVILFSHPSLKAVYTMTTNLYVSIIGVVFATVWSSSSTMLDKSTSQSSTPAGLSVLRFQRDVVTFTDSSPEFKHADSQYTNTTESDGPFETNLERSTRNLPFNSDIKAGE